MRNLKKHPVTIDEIVACLQVLKDTQPKDEIGSIVPTLLDAAINHVENNRRYALRHDGKLATVADIPDLEQS